MEPLTEREREARRKVCLPLDGLNTLDEVRARVRELSAYVGLFKIGKESYTRFGPEVVRLVQGFGSEIFLDLKYHDIPNTVRGAARAAAGLGIYMFNVHASGGLEMMKAAVEGARSAEVPAGREPPAVIAVTVLTSLDRDTLNNQLAMPGPVEERVSNLARLAMEAGCDGIVCSAVDLHALKGDFPEGFLFVTPGIKGPTTAAGSDQKRVFTPGNAVRDGASVLVIGRAITGAEDRPRAALEVLRDMAAA
jgi:orotidine-5'-phosphate decarboxylase